VKVQKRDGNLESVDFNKIQKRIKDLAVGLKVEVDVIVQRAIERMFDGVKTKEIDEHLASIATAYSLHPDYNSLAGRICVSSLQKETAIGQVLEGEKEKILKMLKASKLEEDHKMIQRIKNSLFKDEKREEILNRYLSGKKVKDEELTYLLKLPRFYKVILTMHEQGVLSDELLDTVIQFRDEIENHIDYSRDFMFDYFGFKTLEKSYLLKKYTKKVEEVQTDHGIEKKTKTKSEVIERPQDMFMRVSLGICGKDLKRAFKLYDLMSQGYYTHATPTLFNAGTKRPQMSSCFLLANMGDSIEGIFSTFNEEALISKNAGGIGVWYHNVRARGSVIKGTNGISNGIVPFLKIKNEIARGIDQGGGKRKGSIAVYLEPWHSDIKEFLPLRKNNGSDETRARDLFLALWVPSLFYKRVEEGGKWSLFDPAVAKGLYDAVGEDFNKLYEKYEQEGLATEVIDARELMKDIFEVQMETGTPYILNKDHANLKSNQRNLGTIKSSNLCTEIIQFSSHEETAVCNLASICLPMFVVDNKEIDHKLLHSVVEEATRNCNLVIDKNYYVNEKTRRSNMRHRPIGLGVQGLADVFFKLRIPYDSEEAKKVNEEIFETIYHAAVTTSIQLAKEEGHYESMNENGGAPITKGLLQFDLWGKKPKSGRYNWDDVKEGIKKHGLRNSLLVAPMPTASTSQIFGNTESFEPLTENIYKRKTLAGEYLVVNKYLIRHLEELGYWNSEVIDYLKRDNGSLVNITFLSQEVKNIYKTVWEMSLKKQIDMSADRGAYICQSQSFNIHMDKPSMERMKDVYLYAHKVGLKTACYYFKTNASTTAQKVTLSNNNVFDSTKKEEKKEEEDCLVCGA
jgi:ribonucleoside-diphosphate reductase alpha chain